MLLNQSTEEWATAYHESGHAVMGVLRDLPPCSISIAPTINGEVGRTEFPPVPRKFRNYLDSSFEKRDYIETRILIAIAGTIAHDIYTPGRIHDSGDSHDLQRAKAFIEQNASWAVNDRDGYLQCLRDLSRQMIAENWAYVQAIAFALVKQRELTREHVMGYRPA